MKKFIIPLAVGAVAVSAFLGGCFVTSGSDGADGKDGQNASALQFYELAKAEGLVSSVDEFLSKYLNYTPDELNNALSLQRTMNYSLRSGVSLAAQFTSRTGGGSTSFGSGVVVDFDEATGETYIVTNCHVIYNDASREIYAEDIYCYLYGHDNDYNSVENRFKASVIGASVEYDIALLKASGGVYKDEAEFDLKAAKPVAASFSENDDVFVGEEVYAVGNAEAQGMSVTRGFITKERETVSLNLSDRFPKVSEYYNDYSVIRTDAAINEGNSGGALFGRDGSIKAIVNAKVSSEGVESMGYALPASNVKRLVQLMRDSYNTKGFSPSDASLTRAHLSAGTESKTQLSYWNEEKGVTELREKIVVTESDGVLEVGDTIRKIKITDGSGRTIEERAVERSYHLEDTLLSARNGYTVTLTVSRGGELKEVRPEITFKTFK